MTEAGQAAFLALPAPLEARHPRIHAGVEGDSLGRLPTRQFVINAVSDERALTVGDLIPWAQATLPGATSPDLEPHTLRYRLLRARSQRSTPRRYHAEPCRSLRRVMTSRGSLAMRVEDSLPSCNVGSGDGR